MKTYNSPAERAAQVKAGKICRWCGRVKCRSFKAGTNIVKAKDEARSEK